MVYSDSGGASVREDFRTEAGEHRRCTVDIVRVKCRSLRGTVGTADKHLICRCMLDSTP